MLLYLSSDILILDVQQAFSKAYPFLKLEFCRQDQNGSLAVANRRLPSTVSLKAAGLVKEGSVDIQSTMTVLELERTLLKEFGLHAQVSRQSGKLWLETNMTDEWTLQKQNEHGRELTNPPIKKWEENNKNGGKWD